MNTQPNRRQRSPYSKKFLLSFLLHHNFDYFVYPFPSERNIWDFCEYLASKLSVPDCLLLCYVPASFIWRTVVLWKNSEKIYFKKGFWKKYLVSFSGSKSVTQNYSQYEILIKKETFYQKKRSSITNQDIYFKDNLYLQDI